MRGWEKLGEDEIEERYERVMELVKSWKDIENPEIQLAPMSERDLGEEALIIEIVNLRGQIDLGDRLHELKRTLPGASLKSEIQPNGKARYFVTIPILVPASKRKHSGKGGVIASNNKRPSDIYALFLVMLIVFFSTVLFFKWQ